MQMLYEIFTYISHACSTLLAGQDGLSTLQLVLHLPSPVLLQPITPVRLFIFLFIATTMSLKLHSLGPYLIPKTSCCGSLWNQSGMPDPREAAGQRRNSDVPEMKAPGCPACLSQSLCEWRAPRMRGTVTVKIANAAVIATINHSIRSFALRWGIFLLTGGIYLRLFFTNQRLINALDGLLSLLLQRLLGWRRGCFAARHSFFLLCSGSSVSASNFSSWFFFLLLWGQLFLCMPCSSNSCQLSGSRQHFQRVLTFICSFCVCVPTVREMSGFLICLIGNAVKKLKWDPGKEPAWEFAWDLW